MRGSKLKMKGTSWHHTQLNTTRVDGRGGQWFARESYDGESIVEMSRVPVSKFELIRGGVGIGWDGVWITNCSPFFVRLQPCTSPVFIPPSLVYAGRSSS